MRISALIYVYFRHPFVKSQTEQIVLPVLRLLEAEQIVLPVFGLQEAKKRVLIVLGLLEA